MRLDHRAYPDKVEYNAPNKIITHAFRLSFIVAFVKNPAGRLKAHEWRLGNHVTLLEIAIADFGNMRALILQDAQKRFEIILGRVIFKNRGPAREDEDGPAGFHNRAKGLRGSGSRPETLRVRINRRRRGEFAWPS